MEENYLSIVFEKAMQDKRLVQEDMEDVKNRMWALLAKRVQRYTMGESSSIPTEKAEELFESICYCISIYLKSLDNDDERIKQLIETDMQILFEKGQHEIVVLITKGKELYKNVVSNKIGINNISYHDTLNEIKNFFKSYDFKFMAQDIPCSIDYQLCQPVSETIKGIEYIIQYLKNLYIENEFCKRFDEEKIILILKAYCPNYKEQLINIYEPIVSNVFGLALIGGDVTELDISDAKRVQIKSILNNITKKKFLEKVKEAVDKICYRLAIKDIESKSYMFDSLKNLYERINNSNSLDNIFLSFYKIKEVPKQEYIDGNMMDDEKLRKLIEEIQDCRYLSDKIAMVKEYIHSMRDFVEVVNVCFYEEELYKLFDSLDDITIKTIDEVINFHEDDIKVSIKWKTEFQKYKKRLT
jgi:cell fate (sporulation/competence/biofilm development) regulator YlbF (YheA/YmcA/DUF963 family)